MFPLPSNEHNDVSACRSLIRPVKFLCVLYLLLYTCAACQGEVEETVASATHPDSIPFMHSCGINTLISDSGVIRYRLVAEEWEIYSRPNKPNTWKFMKGMLMERFDEDFHIDLFVQCDTAYLHDQRTWELRGRVAIKNIRKEIFLTEELFWDMNEHEMWSHQYIRIITPDRELEGTEFRSNEQMTRYNILNSAGVFPVSDTEAPPVESVPSDTLQTTDNGSDKTDKLDKRAKVPER